LPFTFVRPIADIRVGILTIREKWEYFLKSKTSSLTEKYLSKKFPIVQDEINILINGSILPNKDLVQEIINMHPNQIIVSDETIVAMSLTINDLKKLNFDFDSNTESIFTKHLKLKINNLWDIFLYNDEAIRDDFQLITQNKHSEPLSKTNQLIGENIFIEKGAKIECAVINTSTGPVYIGENAEIMEGSLIRGPFALGHNSQIKMGAKIYGGTTVGPYSKVGGEVSNSVIFGYSNKSHDGFLGNSVIGEWCNIGADSNNSNLKNNYEEVKLWNYANKRFEQTGLQFCGLIMGDHSKCGINTMFNTGTVVGINASIFGAGFQRNFIPSFSWGGSSGFSTYEFNKALDVAKRVYQRRNLAFNNIEEEILKFVYNMTLEFRFI
jgi:UDP-N-acetylglucosamine diphosphorylase/glucosamine-1-phosphate N-acetyltransferase